MKTTEAIAARKTEKVLSDEAWPLPEDLLEVKNKINQIVLAATHAPFHYPAQAIHVEGKELNSIVPWRVHVLHAQECRELANHITSNGVNAGKILQMLHTANALLQVTWLPDQPENEIETPYLGSLRNMEHIAAASSATQNMLLTATALGLPNYWSSGGVLRKEEFHKHLNINAKEILLGSIFLFPEDVSKARVALGGLREKKGTVEQWSREVKF